MSYMRDAFNRRIDSFDPRRDLPNLTAWFDANDLAGADGSAVTVWRDKSPAATSLSQATSANRPTLKTAGPGGRRYVHFGATSYLANTGFGAGFRQSAYAQPNTMFAIARVGSSSSGVVRSLVSGTTNTQNAWKVSTENIMYVAAATTGARGGSPVNDDTWHVLVCEATPSYNAQYVDGTLVGVTGSQTQGTQAMGGLSFGADASGGIPLLDGDLSAVLICNARLTPAQIDATVAWLAASAGLTVAPAAAEAFFVDTTDAGGQAVRYWTPPQPAASIPWLIWSHPFTQTQAIAPGYFAYTVIHAAMQNGWGVIATNQHGDSWGNDNAVGDILAAYNLANGVIPASAVILLGASMGGLATATAVRRGTLPAGKVKGVVGMDAVFDLTWAYTGNSGGYTSGINTAYGIASAGAIPAANDPMQQAAATFAGVPWRFYASTADTSVAKANNTDAFVTKLAGAATPPAEYAVVTHNESVHLGTTLARPRDLVPFIQRCLAR